MSKTLKSELNSEERNQFKKFIRYKEGAQMYSLSQSKFEQVAKEAGAIYKLGKVVLVNSLIISIKRPAHKVPTVG